MLLFGFGHLLSVVSGVHPEVDADIVEARLKYLQRLPFPPELVKVGKGGRSTYSADSLMKLIVAFELLAAGIVPAQAAGLVSENWPKVSAAMGKAWISRRNPIASILLAARIDGFDTRRGISGTAAIMADEDVMVWRKDRDEKDRRLTVIDLVATAKAIEGALAPEQPVLQLVAMSRDLEAWAQERRQIVRTGT